LPFINWLKHSGVPIFQSCRRHVALPLEKEMLP
jgi:hypothetical protein